MVNRMEVPVRQPFTFGGVPRSEGGTIPDVATTIVRTDPIYVGDAKSISIQFAVSNVSGTTHAQVDYEMSTNYNRKTDTGDWPANALTSIVADWTTDDTFRLEGVSPELGAWIRIKFQGATGNGSFNRIRGELFKQ